MERRRGVPLGRSITQTLSSAVKARRRPSGEGRAPRICATVKVESLIRNANLTGGPIRCSTSAEKGICVCRPDGTSMRQNFPSYAATIALLSGVNE